jgi:hypothetical protein
MMKHDEIRDLLPWYVTGSIEIVEAALVRCRFEQGVRQSKGPARSAWDRLADEIGVGPKGLCIDVGSLMLGLRLGIAAADRQHPVRGRLRLLGSRYNVIGSRTKGA